VRPFRMLVALMVAAMMLFVACGGGGSTPAGAPVEQDELEDAAEDAAEDAVEGSEDVADGILANRECRFAIDALRNNPVAGAFTGDTDPKALDESVEFFRDFASKAPDEIREDLTYMSEYYARVVETFIKSDFNPETAASNPEAAQKLAAEFEKIEKEFPAKQVEAASKNTSDWFAENCEK